MQLALWRPNQGWMAGEIVPLPEKVRHRLEEIPLPPEQAPGASGGDAAPAREWVPDRLPGAVPVAGRGPGCPPHGAPPAPSHRPPPATERPAVRPLFLTRGDGGDGYWAALDLPLFQPVREQPRHGFLVIRSDDLAGGGLFFEIQPWVLGGLAVLVVSVLFWIPFAYGITRYLGRLTRATERIAEGHFDVSLGSRRGDELGRLGRAIERMAGRLDHLVSGQKRFLGDVAHELCGPLARLRTGLGILEQRLPAGEQERLAGDRRGGRRDLRAGRGSARLLPRHGRRAQHRNRGGRTAADRRARRRPRVPRSPSRRSTSPAASPPQATAACSNAPSPTSCAMPSATPAPTPDPRARRPDHRRRPAPGDLRQRSRGGPSSELERLFEPFYRPDAARARQHGGSGLGLAIVRTCIEACHGSVSARRAEAGGLVVEILLGSTPTPWKIRVFGTGVRIYYK